MFGPFKPTARLCGGLLWQVPTYISTISDLINRPSRKIPWRMSDPQKQRQRRRLRNVDNVVTVLATALSRQKRLTATDSIDEQTTSSSSESHEDTSDALSAEPETASAATRRHHKGPKRGDLLPGAPDILLSNEARRNGTIRLIERWKAEMPTEAEMLPKDKYTMFDRKAKRYRKGVHKLPKWTRVSQRLNPPGF